MRFKYFSVQPLHFSVTFAVQSPTYISQLRWYSRVFVSYHNLLDMVLLTKKISGSSRVSWSLFNICLQMTTDMDELSLPKSSTHFSNWTSPNLYIHDAIVTGYAYSIGAHQITTSFDGLIVSSSVVFLSCVLKIEVYLAFDSQLPIFYISFVYPLNIRMLSNEKNVFLKYLLL